jgi:hypothetical protein
MDKDNPMEFYTLTADITNPKPDRRKKFDWRAQETVPAGGVYIVTPYTEGEKTKSVLAPVAEPGAWIPVASPLVKAMKKHLEEHQPKFSEIMRGSGVNPLSVLKVLLKRGEIDVNTIYDVVEELL